MKEHGIVVENVWKKFHRGELHDSLRDLVPALAKRLVGRGPRRDQLEQGDFWALKDISFQVRPGEALGIIGPNGAGKSTILKILNRILRPNRGNVEVNGRVGALIEIAAGFHPDLTGRENIFLQGAIMGMRRAEIQGRFDEIVEFSGIPDFIDTPVKRYSSGMNARLGFSVAAHLSPEVLLIDEVLAVGDFSFQYRAFERLEQVVRSGIPVVVVSHQLHRIASLCDRALLLVAGEIAVVGKPSDCIAAYLDQASQQADSSTLDGVGIRIDSFVLGTPGVVLSGQNLSARMTVTRVESTDAARFGVGLRVRSMSDGTIVYSRSSQLAGIPTLPHGTFQVEFAPQMNLPGGTYLLEPVVWDAQTNRLAAAGPTIPVAVEVQEKFRGSVQLNCAIRVSQANVGQGADT
jgi:lipopolysaccharide transport system ATP-binding protein